MKTTLKVKNLTAIGGHSRMSFIWRHSVCPYGIVGGIF
jgi:hypothetical protein